MAESELKDWVLVPREPPEELLMSMAIRHDHALGIPGYYDQEFFGAERVSHEARLRAALRDMRKIYEEVVGGGFYRPERADFYPALLPTPTTQEAGHE